MNDTFTSGQDLRNIKDKCFARHNTAHAKEVVLALDKCDVPYFAKFNDSCISLTYDGSYADTVDEIIRKAQSGDYEQMMLEITDRTNQDGYKILLPEIAELLHTTIGTLKMRPDEVQENLCRTYVNVWFCDLPTMKRELQRVLNINPIPEQEESLLDYLTHSFQQRNNEEIGYISRDTQRKIAEMIRQKRSAEIQRSIEQEEHERRNFS
mgnify:CR=1 FL=1